MNLVLIWNTTSKQMVKTPTNKLGKTPLSCQIVWPSHGAPTYGLIVANLIPARLVWNEATVPVYVCPHFASCAFFLHE